jgi:hypothetical protein
VIGLDTETAPLPEHTPPPTWLAVTRTGRRAIDQPRPKDKTAFDPRRAGIRLVQVYDPKRRTSFVIEWQALDPELLRQLMGRQVLIHNALFDLQMLARGVEPPNVIDTTQLAALALGPGKRSHGEGEPQANAAIPVIARMPMRGLPFDPITHAATVRTWELEYAEQRELFRRQTGHEVPVGAPAIRAWLSTCLSLEAQDAWPRTDTGLLKTSADEIKRLAQDHPEVLPLLEVQKREKRLSTFGAALKDRVSTVTGRCTATTPCRPSPAA